MLNKVNIFRFIFLLIFLIFVLIFIDDTSKQKEEIKIVQTSVLKGKEPAPELLQIKDNHTILKAPKLIASNGTQNEGIKVLWNKINGAQNYELYRYPPTSKKWHIISANLTQNSYMDFDVIRGENYYYKIRVNKNDKWSKFSKKDRGFAKLKAPKNIQASDGLFSFINIKWEKSEGAKHYTIYRAKQENELFIPLKENFKQETYKDIYAVAGEYYYYKVKAFSKNSSLLSKSEKGYVAIKTPSRLMATDASKKSIIISWEQEDDTKQFNLYRSKNKNQGYELIATVIDDDYYNDKFVKPAVIYYYKVKAYTKELSSLLSKSDSGYVDVEYPWGLEASDGTSPYYINLHWKGMNADTFQLYRAENVKGPYALIDNNVSVKEYRDSNITYCQNYYYKVQAIKNGITSRLSSLDSGYGKCGAFVETFSGTGILGGQDAEQKMQASYNRPTGIAYQNGSLYIADTYNHRIRVVTPDGRTSTLAGSGDVGNDDGMKDQASFYRPTGIAIDSNGTIYVAEVDNHLIRKITPDSEVSVFAGSGKRGDRDGKGKNAVFNKPYSLAIDSDGSIYVTELGNHKIKKITPDAMVTTFAGNGKRGNRDGSLLYASFDRPSGIVINGKGNIYISDSNNNNIRVITKGGEVNLFAGSGKKGDEDGNGVAATFNNPMALAIDKKGNIFVADTGNYKIRMITKEGIVKTIAGSANGGDKDGFGNDAAFFSPRGITLDENNNIYVTDFHVHKIRKIKITKKL